MGRVFVMKGIILAAGSGSRLSPVTDPVSKVLLPVYDRPMVYCPLSVLMSAGIKDILVISGESELGKFIRTLGDGSQFGINIQYAVQYVQDGTASALTIAKDFSHGENVFLIFGDNIFYGQRLEQIIRDSVESFTGGCMIFGASVKDPERFGVVEFDSQRNVASIEEKPLHPRSNYAVVGMYLYDANAPSMVSCPKPSARGELEISDLNRMYLDEQQLSLQVLDEDTVWIDAGTFESLLQSATFVHDKELELGTKILCPEIVAYKMGFVERDILLEWLATRVQNDYYLRIKEIVQTT